MSEPPRSIERSQLVALSVEDSFAFFADAYNLEALTPPWLGFRILTRDRSRCERERRSSTCSPRTGSPSAGAPRSSSGNRDGVSWTAQVKGPFRLWEHTHAFEERPDGTLIRDTVLYRMPYGPLGAIAHRILVARDLERIFDYRRDAVDAAARRAAARPCRRRVRRLIRRYRPRTEPCAPCRAARVAPPRGPRRDDACGAGGASPALAGRGRTGR